MPELILEAHKRSSLTKGENNRLRREGKIPAVLYGKKLTSTPIYLEATELTKVLQSSRGLNTIFNLRIVDEPDEGPVLSMVREIQRDYLNKEIIHLDLLAISLEEKIAVSVPLHLVGTNAALKEGATLEQTLHEIEVESLPENIPAMIEVDISSLGIGDSISARDILLSEGVTLLTDGDTAVATIIAPRVEEAPPAAEEAPQVEEKTPEE